MANSITYLRQELAVFFWKNRGAVLTADYKRRKGEIEMKHGKRLLTSALVALAGALALIAPAEQGSLAAGATIYVDADATGANNGSSWDDAFTDLPPALAAAVAEDEIWVAEGTYKPSQEFSASDPRSATFQMKNGVAIYGGFDPSVGDIGMEDRNWEANPTILSGDIGITGDETDNSYHVFYHPAGLNLNSSAILDGFSITGGNATGNTSPHWDGGGMYNDGSSPTLANCSFLANSAAYSGGGMVNDNTSSPTLTNCAFEGNSAGSGGGMYNANASSPVLTIGTFLSNSADYGGGMFNEYSASPSLTKVAFAGNQADTNGGGMLNYGSSSPSLTNCTFSDNLAAWEGGGMFNYDSSSPVLIHCTFFGNSTWEGGGMFNEYSSSPSLTNVTFANNQANDGAGMYNYDDSSPTLTNCTFSRNFATWDGGGMFNANGSSPLLTNCILWGDTIPEIYDQDSTPVVTHSNIQGGYEGEGNIDAHPWFADPDNGDFHLEACSPCIDRGDNLAPDLPEFDFEGDDRILDGDGNGTAIVDMGVDEVTVPGTCYRGYLPLFLREN